MQAMKPPAAIAADCIGVPRRADAVCPIADGVCWGADSHLAARAANFHAMDVNEGGVMYRVFRMGGYVELAAKGVANGVKEAFHPKKGVNILIVDLPHMRTSSVQPGSASQLRSRPATSRGTAALPWPWMLPCPAKSAARRNRL